jgi:hypothetical protein
MQAALNRRRQPIAVAVRYNGSCRVNGWSGIWPQPIAASENPAEMDRTRIELARLMATGYRTDS